MSATPLVNLPVLKERDRAWDADAADKRVREWASKDGSSDKKTIDWDKYREAHFWVDPKNTNSFGGYKLPFADIVDGKLQAIPRGIFGCAAAVQGGRGGVDIPDADEDEVREHIEHYYEEMAKLFDDKTIVAPWKKQDRSLAVRSAGTMKTPMLQVRAVIQPETYNADKHTVDIVWTTGAIGERENPWTGDRFLEELEVSPEAVRLDRLNNGAPFLAAHNSFDLKGQIGVVERAWLKAGKGHATVRFSQRPEVAPIEKDVADKILRNISVGYRVFKFEKTQGPDDKIPTYRAVDWEPLELSLVPVPFDAGAQVRSGSSDRAVFEAQIVTRDRDSGTQEETTIMPTERTEEEIRADERRKEREDEERSKRTKRKGRMSSKDEEDEEGDDDGDEPDGDEEDGDGEDDDSDEDSEDTRRRKSRARRAKRKSRSLLILEAVRTAGLPQTFAEDLIGRDVSVSYARKLILDRWAREDKVTTQTTRAVSITRDERQFRARAMEDALQLRANPAVAKDMKPDQVEAAREYRGMRLLEMARSYLEGINISVRGMTPGEIAGIALGLTRAEGAGASTSDFPNLLMNVAHKTLRQAYQIAPQTWRPITRQVSAADFKPMYRIQLGGVPILQEVPEGGEVTRGQVYDHQENYSVKEYGKIITITRKAIINDDLDGFSRLPMLLGRQAANLESNLVWGVITGNAAMADSYDLFSAQHSNIIASGAGAAPSIAEFSTMKQKMRLQKDLDGTTLLNLEPKFVAAPAALETTIDQLVTETRLYANNVSTLNPFMSRLVPIIEPRLDVVSETGYYMFADPGQIDVIECAYLDGNEGVYLESRIGFEVEGLELKARLDFGVAPIDFRGMVFNYGA